LAEALLADSVDVCLFTDLDYAVDADFF